MNKDINKDNGQIIRVLNLTENMLLDCYYIAGQTRANNADMIYATMQKDVNDKKHVMFAFYQNQILYGFIKGHLDAAVAAADQSGGVPRAARIDWLFVDSQKRRSGIGSRLIAAYQEYCIANGVGRITVKRAPNLNARDFYVNRGFLPTARAYIHAKELSR